MDGREAQYERFRTLLSGVGHEGSILDLGCGVGHLVDYLVDNGKPGLLASYTGCDPLEAGIPRRRIP